MLVLNYPISYKVFPHFSNFIYTRDAIGKVWPAINIGSMKNQAEASKHDFIKFESKRHPTNPNLVLVKNLFFNTFIYSAWTMGT